jgi:hypothetical protein
MSKVKINIFYFIEIIIIYAYIYIYLYILNYRYAEFKIFEKKIYTITIINNFTICEILYQPYYYYNK